MPKTRIQCAQQVRAAFLETERSADAVAAAASQCVGAMIDARTKGRFPTGAGAEELAMISEGLRHALAARACFLKAHPGLARLSDEFSIPLSYGPDECPPELDRPFTTGTGGLRIVA